MPPRPKWNASQRIQTQKSLRLHEDWVDRQTKIEAKYKIPGSPRLGGGGGGGRISASPRGVGGAGASGSGGAKIKRKSDALLR